jgi:hypothetical protein
VARFVRAGGLQSPRRAFAMVANVSESSNHPLQPFRERHVNLRLTALVTAVAAFAASSIVRAGDEIKLVAKFKQGDKTYFEHVLDMTQSIEMPNGPGAMTFKSNMITGMMEEVGETKAGGAEVRMTFDRMAMDFDAQMMAMKFDSDAPDDSAPMISTIFEEMVGGTLTMRVDATGEVTGFDGMKAISQKVTDANPANPMWMQMRNQFTDDYYKDVLATSRYAIFPDKPVKVGDTWTSNMETEPAPGMKHTVASTYTLDSVGKKDGRNVATISVTQTFKKAEGDAAAGGAEIRVFEGSGKGTAMIDIDRGMLIEQSGDATLRVEGRMPGPMGTTDMKIQVESGLTMRILSAADRAKQKADAAAMKAKKEAEAEAKAKAKEKAESAPQE